MAREIEIVILPNGDVTIEGKGYVGRECDADALLADLTTLLDDPETVKKPEYYQGQRSKQQVKQGR